MLSAKEQIFPFCSYKILYIYIYFLILCYLYRVYCCNIDVLIVKSLCLLEVTEGADLIENKVTTEYGYCSLLFFCNDLLLSVSVLKNEE